MILIQFIKIVLNLNLDEGEGTVSRLDVMSSVAGALSGFEGALNSEDAYGVVTGLSQTTAALGSVA